MKSQGQILHEAMVARQEQRQRETVALNQAKRAFIFAHPALKEAWQEALARDKALFHAAANGGATGENAAWPVFDRLLAQTLAGEGLPADHFEYHPACPLCGDTGAVGEGFQRPCSCVLNQAAAAMRDTLGVREDARFETYDLDVFPEKPLTIAAGTQRQLMAKRVKQCRAWADALPSPAEKNLLLLGGSGLGKTYLLHCIANRAIQKGVYVMMTTAYQLVQAALDREQTLAPYVDAELLILDDLGTEPNYQKVTRESFFALINDRITRGLPTAISTNLAPEELRERYGDRLASRLLQGRESVLRFEGDDLRLAGRA